MEQLPEVVKAAITAACNSGRTLSWKVQEDGRGTLIQLVWKPVCADTKVCSNWNARKRCTDLTTSGKLVSSKPKKLTPSRARRNARPLQAFLERKQSAQPVSERMDLNELQPAPLDHQTEQAHLEFDGNVQVDQGSNLACERSDVVLKSFIDNEVQCVDFHLDDGGPGLDLELNCGEIVRKPIDVERPNSDAQPLSGVSHKLSVEELMKFDDIEFELRDVDGSPGLLLKKDGLVTWTPIASRTRSRSRVSSKDLL